MTRTARRIAPLWLRLLLGMLAGAGMVPAAQAQDIGVLERRAGEIVAVLKGDRPAAQVFDPAFLADVPPAQLDAITAQLVAQGGKLHGHDGLEAQDAGAASFTLRFARASAAASIELSPAAPHRVTAFRIFALSPDTDSFTSLDTAFAALPGKAGYAIYRLGTGSPELVHGKAADRAFAVGSTFKLYVLAALARQVREGRRAWSDVVPVAGKSFPGGTVHMLPDGAPVTLHTLASLMIAISDNTATDILVRVVGQEALAGEVRRSGHALPDTLAPMLTTAQFFALKEAGPATTRRYARASLAERSAILATLDVGAVARARPGAVFGAGPVAIEDVEWFASPADLAGIMDSLRRLDNPEVNAILAINPALDDIAARRWAYAGYKGGSERGVISMTWLLRAHSGAWFVVTGSWNDPAQAVDEARFELLMMRLAKLSGK